jgi:hypothetical protein
VIISYTKFYLKWGKNAEDFATVFSYENFRNQEMAHQAKERGTMQSE